MIAGIVVITFFVSLFLSYRLGCINGFNKGFEEFHKLHENNFDSMMD